MLDLNSKDLPPEDVKPMERGVEKRLNAKV